MNRREFDENAMRMYRRWQQYCETGIDKPTWDSWCEQFAAMQRPLRSRLQAAVIVALHDLK